MWSLGMILHKMLFFNLPYRYASDGDGNSAAGESDKMERLEREVLNYPGCVSFIRLIRSTHFQPSQIQIHAGGGIKVQSKETVKELLGTIGDLAAYHTISKTLL